jgi:ABC-type sugar transport system permease subunit
MKRMAYLMVTPAVIFFLLFPAAATYLVGHLSLFKTDYLSSQFVGVLNYVTILSDVKFWRSMVNGLLYAAMIVPMMLAALFVTGLLASDFSTKVQNVVKFVVYIPVLAAGVIIANVWKWIYAKDGLMNWALGIIGVGPVAWLSDPMMAKVAISLMFVMTVLGGFLIITLAAIVSVPKQLLEAARIDGASGLQIKFRIVLPIVMPTVLLVVMLLTISSIQMWEFVYQLTSGGPAGATATPIFDLYETAFTYGKYGLASAKAVVLMLVILALVTLQKRVERLGK